MSSEFETSLIVSRSASVERALHADARPVEHMGIDHRGADVLVAPAAPARSEYRSRFPADVWRRSGATCDTSPAFEFRKRAPLFSSRVEVSFPRHDGDGECRFADQSTNAERGKRTATSILAPRSGTSAPRHQPGKHCQNHLPNPVRAVP